LAGLKNGQTPDAAKITGMTRQEILNTFYSTVAYERTDKGWKTPYLAEKMKGVKLLSDLIEPFVASGAEMGTLKRALHTAEELQNAAVVKVVTDRQGRALYFSRAPIPLVRDDPDQQPAKGLHYIHLGVYIYTRETLLRLASLPTGGLEEAEKLEQLRALDHGIAIHVWETQHASLRIDTPADVLSAVESMRRLALNKPLETSTRL